MLSFMCLLFFLCVWNVLVCGKWLQRERIKVAVANDDDPPWRSILGVRGGFKEELGSIGWEDHYKKRREVKYQVLAAPEMENLAQSIVDLNPSRFAYHQTSWGKFSDGTDKIVIGGFQPINRLAGQHVLFLCSFHNNDVTLSQFSVMITLLQSFVESLTVVLPFYPVGTMERVIIEGQVATANTYAEMFSNLPSCGRPTRLIVYDLHTLQNRFYLHNHAFASLQTTVPLLTCVLEKQRRDNPSHSVTCIAFPDDGAAKRFGDMFADKGYEIVTCGKIRDGETRSVTIQEGNPRGRRVLIVDDLVQTGGTLHECGLALRAAGALAVDAFVAHGVFPHDSWKRFARGGDRSCFDCFYLTDSIPTVTARLPKDDVFHVLPLRQKIVDDLDSFTH